MISFIDLFYKLLFFSVVHWETSHPTKSVVTFRSEIVAFAVIAQVLLLFSILVCFPIVIVHYPTPIILILMFTQLDWKLFRAQIGSRDLKHWNYIPTKRCDLSRISKYFIRWFLNLNGDYKRNSIYEFLKIENL